MSSVTPQAASKTPRRRRTNVKVVKNHLGRGVTATRSFLPGQTIGRIHGVIYADPNYESDYCMDLAENLTLEPAEPFRYLNHSCRPNCELMAVEYDGDEDQDPEYELYLVALTSITAGDELAIDYAWPADAAIPCACNAPECRGWIVAEEELCDLQLD